MAAQIDVGHHDGTGIDEGVARNSLLLFQLDDGVESIAGGFAAHSFPKLVTNFAQREGQGENLGDRLDRKTDIGVAARDQAAVCGGDGDAELVGINLGEFGNIVCDRAAIFARSGPIDDVSEEGGQVPEKRTRLPDERDWGDISDTIEARKSAIFIKFSYRSKSRFPHSPNRGL